MTAEDKTCLWDDYERLRSYALSPFRTLSGPIGLDLWEKRGFLSWIAVMICRDRQEESGRHAEER